MSSLPKLSIIIGALNEEKRIGRTLGQLAQYLNETGWMTKTEVIIVTADATDKTHEIVAKEITSFPLHQHIKPGPKVGKGRDIAAGMLAANGELCIFMDADAATPLRYIAVARELHSQFPRDVIVGARNTKAMHRGLRTGISLLGNVAFRLATGLYLRDTQCGFKVFPHDIAQAFFGKLQITGWGFDMEIIAMCQANGIRVRELSIPDWQDVPGGLAGGKLRAVWASAKDLIKVTYRYRLGRYRGLL